jgi:Tfp pilus assembly PilM family ATPase
MLRFFERNPALGIEVADSVVRVAVLSGGSGAPSLMYSRTADLPDGVVAGCYGAPNVLGPEELAAVLRQCLSGAPGPLRRAALSLPDGVFRIQTLDFDELPQKEQERERLIRWRLEKAAAFDLADTVLRYQLLKRQSGGQTVLACVAKQAVIAQYEQVLRGLGLDPWHIGVTSFHIVNLYAPVLAQKTPVFAFARVTGDSLATIVCEGGEARYYRYKDVKRGSIDDVKARIMREIEDSLHFYTHRDRTQVSEVRCLFLAGEPALSRDLAVGLGEVLAMPTEVLTSDALPIGGASGVNGNGDGELFVAAFGAGRAL